MAGWDSGPDSDEEPLNMHLFNRKVIGFIGFAAEKENILKNIVQQLGASCEDYPKPNSSKVFTSPEYFDSLMENVGPLYNVTFIRDCIDANKYLNIEEYRFGPNYLQKKDFPDFEPCCQNYHNNKRPCLVCDPLLKPQETVAKQKSKPKSTQPIQTNETINSKKMKIKDTDIVGSSHLKQSSHTISKIPWQSWEERAMLDYIIHNNLILIAKSPSLYKRMVSEGYLAHRTADALRTRFRIYVLRHIESYDLPKSVIKKFKVVRTAARVAGRNMAFKKPSMLQRQVIKNNKAKKQQMINNFT